MENFIFCTVLKQILHFMCLNPSTDSNDEFIYLIAFYKDQLFTTKTRWRFQLADLNGTEKTLPSILKKGYYKTVHPAPSSSTQLISISTQLISTSNQLISTSNQLHPPPPSSFQRPASSLQHPQQYSNQNIALNWAISPSLGRKTQSCQFRLKIGTHGISRMLTLIPTLIF